MSDFYNLSIIILVCTKNTVYLCKQTTGQIDGAMIAFLGCKFAGSPLSEEFPGELGGRRGKRGGKSQAGFFLRASLRFSPPRDCKAGCIGDNPTFSDPPPTCDPLGRGLGTTFFLTDDDLCSFHACLYPLLPDFGQRCLGSPIPPSDPVSDEEHFLGLSGATSPVCVTGRERVWLSSAGLLAGSLLLLCPGIETHSLSHTACQFSLQDLKKIPSRRN